jgi:RPA family protein
MATTNSQSPSQQTTVPQREVAKLVFAAELNNATYTFKTSEDERAPVYVALPTGERANRVCLMGTITDIENVGSDGQEYLQARVVDPTGTVFVYAGQYQYEALKDLKEIQPPKFVAVVGKPRTYKTDDGRINVSIVPEAVNVVDSRTRNVWVYETARQTLERVRSVQDGTSKLATLAREKYGHDGSHYSHVAALALQELLDIDDSEETSREAVMQHLEERKTKEANAGAANTN